MGNGSRPADEDEKGRLKSVLGVVMVAEDPAADAPDHRAVPPHQRGEVCQVGHPGSVPRPGASGRSPGNVKRHSSLPRRTCHRHLCALGRWGSPGWAHGSAARAGRHARRRLCRRRLAGRAPAARASRRKASVRNDGPGGTDTQSGPWVQISRLGNPLINEVVVPLGMKDYWNTVPPSQDAQFAAAGAVFSTATCGPCLGGYMGVADEQDVIVSTTNRNFRGRMGHVEAHVYLANPAVAIASAITGRITDQREIVDLVPA